MSRYQFERKKGNAGRPEKSIKRVDFLYLDLSRMGEPAELLLNIREGMVGQAFQRGMLSQQQYDHLLKSPAVFQSMIDCRDRINEWAEANDSLTFIFWDELQKFFAVHDKNRIKALISSDQMSCAFNIYTGSGMAACWKGIDGTNKAGNDWLTSTVVLSMPLRSTDKCLDLVSKLCREKFPEISDEDAEIIRYESPPVAAGLVYYYITVRNEKISVSSATFKYTVAVMPETLTCTHI
jgi:hypothetical protein